MTAGALLLALGAGALAAEHPSIKRPVNVPPSAELTYKIEARQKGIPLGGEAQLDWHVDAGGGYSINNTARAMLFGKILETRSEGAIDEFGLAPAQFHEKRFRKAPTTVTFDRAAKTMTFSESEQVHPLAGGEQDRSSIQFQLSAVARAAPEKFVAGSEWKFFVAGRRDGTPWVFKVVKRETITTGVGALQAVHLTKVQPPDAGDQHIDLWLAPSLEWYPVKLRIADDPGEYVEQTLEKLAKK